jgi:hypothetical protein
VESLFQRQGVDFTCAFFLAIAFKIVSAGYLISKQQSATPRPNFVQIIEKKLARARI